MAHRNLPGRDGQRRASGKARALPAQTASAGNLPSDNIDTLLALAREAGLLVTLDGQIGREKYQSVAGRCSRCNGSPRHSARGPHPTRRPMPSHVARRARLAAREPPAQPHVQRVRAAACRASASAGAPRSRPTARPAVDASLHLNMQACRCTAREPCNG